MMSILAGVPVKSFAAAKNRLATALPPQARIAISQEMARRTCLLLDEAGARPLVLAADEVVAEWAVDLGLEVSLEKGSDLSEAAEAAVALAAGQPWIVVHADLPLLDLQILTSLVAAVAAGHTVIGPSRDGGTPVIGGSGSLFTFSYGPSSYHRHLRRLTSSDPTVVVDARLAIDLDDPTDLRAVSGRVPWIAKILDSLANS
jgi:2-phospho-L-lactate/phosphoenolpyruvate guanylyltransferase